MNDNILKALNDQLQFEFYSAYLYLAMAAYFEDKGLEGMANWMEVQFQEEQTHALKIYRYIAERGGRIELQALGQPPKDWDSPLAAFEESLAHEKMVTERINNLADMSVKAADHATHNMLQWFIAEQVEEEAAVDSIVTQMRLVGGEGHGLFMVDRELKGRAFVDHTQEA
jgi:ferritin